MHVSIKHPQSSGSQSSNNSEVELIYGTPYSDADGEDGFGLGGRDKTTNSGGLALFSTSASGGASPLTSEANQANSGFASCSINLLKTILGAGMLSMPAAMASVGYVGGIGLLLLAAVLSAFGLHLFAVCAEPFGRSASISRVSRMAAPRIAFLFDIAVFVKCFGVATSYLIIIGDMLPAIVIGLGYGQPTNYAWLLSRRFWITAFMLLVVPLAFLKKMDSLKYTSFVGLAAVVYMLWLSMYTAYGSPDAVRPPPGAGMEPIAACSWSTLNSFAVFIFSFTCHQNVFPIQNEAKDNSLSLMNRLIGFTVLSSAVIYLLFSMVSYANFGRLVASNVFYVYPNKGLPFIVARCLYAFLSAFSFPLMTHPCRTALENIIPISRSSRRRNVSAFYLGSTSFIVLGAFVWALLQQDLKLVLTVIGAFAGIPICYLLPFIFYYRQTRGEPWHHKKTASAALAVFGVLAMIVITMSIVATFGSQASAP